MGRLVDSIRESHNVGRTEVIILVVGTILALSVATRWHSNIVIPLILSCMTALLFLLENRFHMKVEEENTSLLRIDRERLMKDPLRELERYTTDVPYYSNWWRTAFLCSITVCIVVYNLSNKVPFFITFIVIFVCIYCTLNWHVHHYLDFFHKNIVHTLRHIREGTLDNYQPVDHI